MKALFSLALILTVSGKTFIDSRVEKYVEDYFEQLHESGVVAPPQFSVQIIVSKKYMAYNAVGMAFGMFTDNIVMIALSPDIFYLDVNQIRWTIYHELTHDIFNIRHESGLFLMRPVLPEYVTSYDIDMAFCQLADYLSAK